MMSKISDLILIGGLDIEIANFPVKVHQPRLSEIALMGEDKFFQSMSIFYIEPGPLMGLTNDLIMLNEEEKQMWIDSSTAYDTFLFLLQATALGPVEDRNVLIERARLAFKAMIPAYTFVFNNESKTMILMSDDKSHSIVVDRDLFLRLKSVAEEIFLLNRFFGVSSSTIKLSAAAQKIADKIALSEQKLNKLKNGNDDEENSQFARIISIMGMNYELDYLSNLTVYQLYNQFERFNLLSNYTQGVQASLAGASGVELVDWYKKI